MPVTGKNFSFTLLSVLSLITTAFFFNMWASTSELCSGDQSFVSGLASHIQASHEFAKKSAATLLRRRLDRKAWPADAPVSKDAAVELPSALIPRKSLVSFLERLSEALLNPNVSQPSAKEVNAAVLLLSLLNSSVKIKKASAELSNNGNQEYRFDDSSVVSAVYKFANSIVLQTSDNSDSSAISFDEFKSPRLASASASSNNKGNPFRMNKATADSMDLAFKEVIEDSNKKETFSSAEKLRTHQTCYLQNDESEICTYEGIVCFDGESLVAVVDKPLEDEEIRKDDLLDCVDKRYNEPSSPAFGCADKIKAFSRDPLEPQLLSSTRLKFTNFSLDFPLPLIGRRWGPANRNGGLYFREMSVDRVWGLNPANLAKSLGIDYETSIDKDSAVEGSRIVWSRDQTGSESGGRPSDAPELPEGFVRLRSIAPESNGLKNPTIDWVDSSLFFVGIDKNDATSPHSSMSWKSRVVGPLFDSMRHNSSRGGFGSNENDGFFRFLPAHQLTSTPSIMMDWTKQRTFKIEDIILNTNKALYRQGRFWNIPSMDAVIFAGEGAREIESHSSLPDWQAGYLKMATSHLSRYFFNDVLSKLSSPTKSNPGHMMCTTMPSAVLGSKFKIFAGRADGWMFRQYAYQHAKLPLCVGKANVLVDPVTKAEKKCYRAHPKYAPRKITVLDDEDSSIFGGSYFWNLEELMETVAEAGLPFERRTKVMDLPFFEQVKLFADTGILIAPHGHPALANVPFLAVHSAVIEIFPYASYGRDTQFECEMLDLHYFPVFSLELPKVDSNKASENYALRNKDFWQECLSQNVSMTDVNAYETCFMASRTFPSVVSKYRVQLQLRDAVDSVGSFSLKNPDWASIAEKEGVPVPPKPDSLPDVDKFGING
jgi:hypothetical protein